MALAHDLDLLPLVMVVGNLVRLSLAAPALANSADLPDLSCHTPHPSLPLKGGGGFQVTIRIAPPPLRGRVGRGVRAPPHLAWRGAPHRDAFCRRFNDSYTTRAGIFLDRFTFRRFRADCRAKNRRRMAALGGDLLQPRLPPALAGVALSALRVWNLRRRQERPA